jgi:hypothetical protein
MLKSFYDKGRNGTLPHLIQPALMGGLNSCKHLDEPSGEKPVGFHLALKRTTAAIMHIRF